MKKLSQVSLLLLAVVVFVTGRSAVAQAPQKGSIAAPNATVALFAVNKYHGRRPACLRLGALPDCQLRYGALYAGDDWDWFESAAGEGNRSVIRDLGLLSWSDTFKVPLVEPLPKLQPGEQRHVTIDTSGADGADGVASSAGGAMVPATSARPKHDGKPKIDPIFAKVIVGHMYVVHVVTEVNDFYALIHVESVERGDNCTVSWRLVSAPDELGTR